MAGENVGYARIYDIYGNEKKGAWKHLIKKYESMPPDTGLSYPDTSWWADPNLLTGNEYNLLMMWLTEPTTYTGKGYARIAPIPRITALRGIVVSHSRSIHRLQVSEKNSHLLEDYHRVVEKYEKEILGDEYISHEDLKNNALQIRRAGSFRNYDRRTRLTSFRYRTPLPDHSANHRIVWVFPESQEWHGKEWLEVPDLLYKCLSIPDKTMAGPEECKRQVEWTIRRNGKDSQKKVDKAVENLVLSYEDILKTQRKD